MRVCVCVVWSIFVRRRRAFFHVDVEGESPASQYVYQTGASMAFFFCECMDNFAHRGCGRGSGPMISVLAASGGSRGMRFIGTLVLHRSSMILP